MSTVIECKIHSNNDIDIRDLLPQPQWFGKHYILRFAVPKPEFFKQCRNTTFFIPPSLSIGDEIQVGIQKDPDTKKKFYVSGMTRYELFLKEVT